MDEKLLKIWDRANPQDAGSEDGPMMIDTFQKFIDLGFLPQTAGLYHLFQER